MRAAAAALLLAVLFISPEHATMRVPTHRALPGADRPLARHATPPAHRASRSHPREHLGDTAVWEELAGCESTHRWDANTGNGFYGGLQFTLSSWRAVGGTGYPHQASRAEQIRRGRALQRLQGWGAWPVCSRKLGLR